MTIRLLFAYTALRVPSALIPGSRLHHLLQRLWLKHSGSGRNHARLMDRGSVSAMRGQAPVSAQRHLSGQAIKEAHQRSGEESGALVGMMRRAIAREEQERAKSMDEQKRMTDRFASTLVIAASIIAAVRLARDDISRPSPRLTSVVNDSVTLARMILESVVR
jgi:hypothetical protein